MNAFIDRALDVLAPGLAFLWGVTAALRAAERHDLSAWGLFMALACLVSGCIIAKRAWRGRSVQA